jgi:hypothetical protein
MISLVTACWGGYWEKYGDQFISSVLGLNTRPDEIVVGTDVPLQLPNGWRQIPISEPYFFDAWNDAFLAAQNEWVTFLSMDDVLLPNAFDDLPLGGDVLVCSVIDSENNICTPSLERFNNIFNEQSFPLVGWAMFRKSTIERVPFRRVNFTDWIAALEYKTLGLDVRVDETIRYFYSLHNEQYSRYGSVQDVNFMKQLLLNHNVVQGREWPPRLL